MGEEGLGWTPVFSLDRCVCLGQLLHLSELLFLLLKMGVILPILWHYYKV